MDLATISMERRGENHLLSRNLSHAKVSPGPAKFHFLFEGKEVNDYGLDKDAPPVPRATPLLITGRGIPDLKPGGIQETAQRGEIRLQKLRSRSSERENLCAPKKL